MEAKKTASNQQSLSQKDKDILTLDVKESMKRYKMNKQAVYDKRYALKKKVEAAGVTIEQLMEGKDIANPVINEQSATKRGRPKKQKEGAEEASLTSSEPIVNSSEKMPVFMKPIEINFDSFSIKLNGVPRHISVNPDTNAIEIDL